MRKFTLTIIAALVAVVAFGQTKVKPFAGVDVLTPKAVALKTLPATAKKAQKKAPISSVDDVVGKYQWDYKQAEDVAVDPSTATATDGSSVVSITKGEGENAVVISGMFPENLEATVDLEEGVIVIPSQVGYTSAQYGACNLAAVLYYAGDATYEAGWYNNGEAYAYIAEDGKIVFDKDLWLCLTINEGQYAGYSISYYYLPSSVMTPTVLTPVAVPDNLVTEEYSIVYTNSKGEQETGSVKVGIDGLNIYIQGLDGYLPEAWVKGTGDLLGLSYTFEGGQYLGSLSGYDFFFMEGGEQVVLSHDAGTDTFTATGEVYTFYGNYYSNYYKNPVLTKITEVAATPADPEITGVTTMKSGDVVLLFDIPIVDTDGNAIITSKLTYQIFAEIDGAESPVTFTTDDYTELTEDMTVIPYGFTDNYDFYVEGIYLNMDISNWTRVGIQSTYTGGGEENQSQLVWFDMPELEDAGIKAIANLPAVSESYADLTGRKVSADAKGLVIKTVTYADGTKKSVKVIRK